MLTNIFLTIVIFNLKQNSKCDLTSQRLFEPQFTEIVWNVLGSVWKNIKVKTQHKIS